MMLNDCSLMQYDDIYQYYDRQSLLIMIIIYNLMN